jgi:hypothetical protein
VEDNKRFEKIATEEKKSMRKQGEKGARSVTKIYRTPANNDVSTLNMAPLK